MPQISRNQGRILTRRLVMNEFQPQIGSKCLSDEEKRSTNMVELNASVWYRGGGVGSNNAVQSEIRKWIRHIESILRTPGHKRKREQRVEICVTSKTSFGHFSQRTCNKKRKRARAYRRETGIINQRHATECSFSLAGPCQACA